MIATPPAGVKSPTPKSWEEIKADPGLWSTQLRERSAIAFVVAMTRGKVPGTPAGCRIERSEKYGAEIIEPDGTRHPISGWWVTARILSWWDSQFTAEDRRSSHRDGWKIMQVNKKWAAEVGEWISTMAWTVPEALAPRPDA